MVDGVLDPAQPLSTEFRAAIAAQLGDFLDARLTLLQPMGAEVRRLHVLAAELLAGGKRLRPAFCFWGYVAAAGLPGDPAPLLKAAASLDVLHVSALVHDDVMDASDLRRGRPAAHRQFEAMHADRGWDGRPDRFGEAAAILLGDLLVMWSVEMLRGSGLPPEPLAAAQTIAEKMRTEVTCGQYLDIVVQARPFSAGESNGLGEAVAEANRVVEFKSARYTVQRPCQLGAAIGGADPALHAALAAYGSPLGRAFQLRDDLLGVFGDPAVTGKPAGDDLREGKRTLLVAHAWAHTDAAGRRLLSARLGDPTLDERVITALQEVITASGARQAVETVISQNYDRSMSALSSAVISDEGRTALTTLASAAVDRTF